ncbi:Rne/Rng family ribonuclease [Bifidobacterium aemilianum]|uniref:Rne/Rng family ribonuclease n=1 Tax=Bifidobacterium aemilianum TaxID=2493120 RepID=UPI0038B26425
MPRVQTKGFDQDETLNSDSNSSGSAQAEEQTAANAKRRGGRRVVRGTGAAGAQVALKVEGSPAQDESQTNGRSKSTGESKSKTKDEEKSKTRSRPQSRSRKQDPQAQAPEQESTEEETSSSSSRARTSRSRSTGGRGRSARAQELLDQDREQAESGRRRRTSSSRRSQVQEPAESESFDAAPTGSNTAPAQAAKAQAPRVRPMTSLLFQEPVLPPVVHERDAEASLRPDDEEEESGSARSRSRRATGSRRGRSHETDSDREDHEDEGRGSRSTRRRSSRRNAAEEQGERESDNRGSDRHEESDVTNESNESASNRRRSRRLNAEERQAADEVGQIEEDLESDEISYRPIEDEEEEVGTRTRSRSRRRNRDDRKDQKDQEESDEEEGATHSRRRRRSEDEETEEGALTRRRRRRRGGRNADEEEQPSANDHERGRGRSRKQQYIDEITDIAGSTRLEAKKQRRRDNRRERSRQSQLIEQDFLARRENVNRLMVVRERERHTQISVIEDDILVEHYVSDIQEVSTVGNIYLGRVQNVLPSMEAAFVDIGQARNGVLYAGEVNWDTTRLDGQPRRIELAFKSGDPVLVQVTKDPIGHKGARLTSQVTLAGRFLVLVPSGGMTGVSRKLSEQERGRLKGIIGRIAPKDMGVIIRTAADGASEEALTKDLEHLERQWKAIETKREEFRHGKRAKLLQGEPDVAIRVVRDIFNDDFSKLMVEGGKVYGRVKEYLEAAAPDLCEKLEAWDPAEHDGKDIFDRWQIDSQLRKGMERQVYLPSGGSIVIDRTEAMTTVDVNTGRYIGRGKSLEETVTRCNLEAAEEIARQLRLRDIGGMIMIDFVDMVLPANRDLVLRRLVECLARDRTKHQVAEVTSLGLVQMTRKRVGQGLVEAFSEECPTCKGRGFLVHDEPTISSDYADPYAVKGGDPFIKTNKHGHGSSAPEAKAPKGSSPDVKAKLAQIAAAAVAANDEPGDQGQESEEAAPKKGRVTKSSKAGKASAASGLAKDSAKETEAAKESETAEEKRKPRARKSRRVVRPSGSASSAEAVPTVVVAGESTQTTESAKADTARDKSGEGQGKASPEGDQQQD